MMVTVVSQLLTKEFIEFKQNKYFIQAVGDFATAAMNRTDNVPHVDDDEDESLKPLLIKISDIPHGLSEQTVQMILENKRYGGSATRCKKFNESERSAVIEYEERAGKSVDHL